LKSYFLSIDKCPTLIKNCFENPETESWLYFLHNISSLYQNAVLKIEKQEISIIEIAQIYSDLKMQVFERKKHLSTLSSKAEFEKKWKRKAYQQHHLKKTLTYSIIHVIST
jgi:hypothetical protein